MKVKYDSEFNILDISSGLPQLGGASLLNCHQVSMLHPTNESRVISGLSIEDASYWFRQAYSEDADAWLLGECDEAADIIEEQGDFKGYWRNCRFDDGEVELFPVGVELKRVSRHIPSRIRKDMRRKSREHDNLDTVARKETAPLPTE